MTAITAKSPSRWNPILAPTSQADEATHVAYFARNAEAPPAAVLVFHGIGEEVRFETLSRAASLILVEAEERGATGVSVVIRSVPRDVLATDLEVRAELAWTETDGTKRQAHVYEAYWAPLTVGKVSYWETVRFLAAAGWNGLRGTFLSGEFRTFDRWLFGGFKPLKATAGTAPLLVVLMLMIGFVAAVIAMAVSAVAGVTKQIGAGGMDAFYNAASFIYSQIATPWNAALRFAGWGDRFMFNATLSPQHWMQAVVAFLLWAALIRAAFSTRYLLTQYAGSLVAYLSPYKDSKFEELRHQIQKVGLDAAKMIYDGFKLPSGWIPEYERVVILGHSLGSVIAYDTLNALINIQSAKLPKGTANPVVERTRAIITFGSPLDKTAFLFRVQLKLGGDRLDPQGELRETMVCAVQPLIASYESFRFNPDPPPYRPKWINLWSRSDIISGHLDYYDDPKIDPGAPQHVQNMIDPGAWIPIAAHNQYWTKKLLRKTVYDELF